MKGFILGLTLLLSASAFADMDPSSQFVTNTMTQIQQLLQNKDNTEKFNGFCVLAQSHLANVPIGISWLGDFNNLARDQKAARQFYKLVPAIVINKVFGNLGKVVDASFTVDPQGEDRGNGVFAVGVTVSTSKNTYHGKAIVEAGKDDFQLIDVEYLGFSAFAYLGREYQGELQSFYSQDPDKSLPVSQLVDEITSDSAFMQCP